MIVKIIIFLLLLIISYIIVEYAKNINFVRKINNYIKDKNDKYYEEIIKYYEKNKKLKFKSRLNIFHKINILLDKSGMPKNLFVNPITVCIVSIICFVLCYFCTFRFLKIVTLSFIVSVPCFFIPILIINFIGNYRNEKIEKIFPNFLLQLKNYTKINNDIIYAMHQIETIEPLQSYIDIFLIEINSGAKFEKAIINLKEKINVEAFKSFFTNLEYCYLYGGSFVELIDKSYKLINELQVEKENRIAETKSARLVLFILIFLDLFVYITTIRNDYENYIIMQKSFIGNFILYWNFLSMWLLVTLAMKVKKLDY